MKADSMKNALRGGALLLALLLTAPAASAEQLELPQNLMKIEEEAFAGDRSIREVVIPDGATSIGARAFADCTKLGWVTIPGSVTEFGEDCLKGCADDLLIRTEPGSAAMRYARANQHDYQAGTTYRALLVGQLYENNPDDRLYGSLNDLPAMEDMLTRFPGTDYQVTARYDLGANDILSEIARTFAGAKEQDVSLFYYSGHGVTSNMPSWQGAMYGADGDIVTANRLRAALDKVPGRKIVIIDACYSGAMISPNMPDVDPYVISISDAAEDVATAQDFVNSFISAFAARARGGLIGNDYFVMTSAAEDETSYETGYDESTMMGAFTSGLLKGWGYDRWNDKYTERFADVDQNGVLTMQETYEYARRDVLSSAITEGQHVQVFPTNCDWFGMLRTK